MHCPRCGQQQVSEDTKFCSSCGFPLGLVSELLAHGGFLPQLAELYKSKRWLTRRNGVIFSLLWFIFFLLVMAPFWAILDIDAMGQICAVVGIFGGLMWLIASLLFLKSSKNDSFITDLPSANIITLHAANQRNLPPQQTQPAQSYAPPVNQWKAPDTGEFARPPSVTENTTKLLKKDE